MLKCKSCGTANSPNSSVCVNCGASFSEIPKNSTETNSNEIFSSRNSGDIAGKALVDRSKEIYSSRSNYDKEQQRKLFEKIRKQEEALGEVAQVYEIPSKTQKTEPVVINRKTHSDVVTSNTSDNVQKQSSHSKSKPSPTKRHTIPQRVIESSDSQTLKQKAKPATSADSVNQKKKTADQNVTNDSNREKRKQERINEKQGNKMLKDFEKKRHLEEKQLEKDVRLEEKQNKKMSNRPQKSDNLNLSKNDSVQEKTELKTAQQPVRKPVPMKKPTQESVQPRADGQPVRKPVPMKKPTQESVQPKADGQPVRKPVPMKKPTQESVQPKADGQPVRKPVPMKKPTQESVQPKADGQPVRKPVPMKKPEKNIAEQSVVPKSRNIPSVTEVSSEQTKAKKKIVNKGNAKNAVKENTNISYNFSDEDINENKNLAACSYFGIFLLLPFAKRGESEFCKAHTKQGMATFIYSLIVYAITLAIVIGLRVLLVWTLKLPFIIYNIATLLVAAVMLIAVYVPVFEGALSAFSGTYKSVPFVGRFVNKKDK